MTIIESTDGRSDGKVISNKILEPQNVTEVEIGDYGKVPSVSIVPHYTVLQARPRKQRNKIVM
ncbi:MAG: hypothetical protein ACK4NY_21640 [Spirosomataceae bacterium]